MADVLVTGADGQVGSEIRHLAETGAFGGAFHFTDREILDITDPDAIEAFLRKHPIGTIVNCAAYTAVDRAESQPEQADAVNHLAVAHLAAAARRHGIRLLHLSTDYVFDGTNHRPYTEEDPAAPRSVYGATKLRGEEAMRQIAPPNSLIVRTSWVYSGFGANFVKTMLRLGRERDELGVVADQIGAPTYARDLAATILGMLNVECSMLDEEVGIYHYSNEGVASWYDFAKAIFEIANIDCKVNPIGTEAYPTPAPRPHYSVLDKRKIKERFGIEIPHWRESLEGMLSGSFEL